MTNRSKPMKTNYISSVFNNKKGQFNLKILKINIVGLVFDFLVS